MIEKCKKCLGSYFDLEKHCLELHKEIAELNKKHDDVVNVLNRHIEDLECNNDALREQIAELNNRIAELERYGNRRMLEVTNLKKKIEELEKWAKGMTPNWSQIATLQKKIKELFEK